jgi:hypothetical protein
MLIWATFGGPVLVAIERGPHAGPWDECSSGCELVITWEPASLSDDDALRMGLPKEVVQETRVPLRVQAARRLLAVWREVLSRTAYPRERLAGPDGTLMQYGVKDGTTYEFWSAGMSGQAYSPEPGSLLFEYVALGQQLATVTEQADEAFWSEVFAMLARLEKRLQQKEPCELVIPAKRNRPQPVLRR